MPAYELKTTNGNYNLFYREKLIASGTKGWANQAEGLHQLFYEGNKNNLLEAARSRGLFQQQGRVKDLADDAYHSLDMISRGAAIFKPGSCEFCAQLLF